MANPDYATLLSQIAAASGDAKTALELQCFVFEEMVSKKPSLVAKGKMVKSLQFGCVKYLRRYVEECEILPMDYINKKECIPYWDYYGKNSRR